MQPGPHEESVTPIEELLAQGIKHAEAGDSAAAIPLFQQALEQDPSQGGVWEMLAQCCMEAGQHDVAYSSACKASQLMHGSPAALVTLGRAARNAGRLKKAASAFEAALELLAAGVEEAHGKDCDKRRALAGEATPRSVSFTHQAVEAQGLRLESQEEIQGELAEVVALQELEVGHAIGLPGLRIREAPAGSQLGPGSVVWDSGVLLARLLVTRSVSMAQQVLEPPQGGLDEPELQQQQQRRLCPLPCEDGTDARLSETSCTATAATGTSNAQRCTCSQGTSGQVAATAGVPLPGVPTFALPPETAPPVAALAMPAAHALLGTALAQLRLGETREDSSAPLAGGASFGSPAQDLSARGSSGSKDGSGGSNFLQGGRVLELGSGAGVVGLAAACLGAHVLATDLPDVLPLLRGNMELNVGMVTAAGGTISAAALDWEQSAAGGLQPSPGSSSSSSSNSTREIPPDASSGSADEEGEMLPGGSAGGVLGSRDLSLLLEDPPWHWVVGADLVYSRQPVESLVRTLAALMRGGGPGAAVDGVPGMNPLSDSSSGAAAAATAGAAAGADSGERGCSACSDGTAAGSRSGVRLLLAHKHRHDEVDAALLGGLEAAGLTVRAVAQDASGKVTVYANSAAAIALGL